MATEAEIFAAVDRYRAAIGSAATAKIQRDKSLELRASAIQVLQADQASLDAALAELQLARTALKDLLNAQQT